MFGNNLKRQPKKSLSTKSRQYGYIQANTPTDDGRGGQIVTWVNTSVEPHAFAVLPLSAMQVMEYKSINVEATHLIELRGEIEVTSFNRITYDDRTFEILVVENIQERGILKQLTCKERRG